MIEWLRTRQGLSARVFKAMGLFGGVQGLGILCSVVRVKLVALWLGPAGVALFGIFNGAVDMVKSFSQLGFRSSAVRDIASVDRRADGLIVTVVRRWGLILGFLGALLMIAAAPLLSRYTFGTADRTVSFMFLSLALLLMSLSAAEEAVLQGRNCLRRLAKASLWGITGGLAVSVPMFYFQRLDSVIPSIIAYALITNLAFMIGRPKAGPISGNVGLRETWSVGKRFIVLGVYMTAADAISQLMSYIFIAWLNMSGGENEVGIYQAGFTMVNRYPALVLSAIAMEYYPRLVSVVGSPWRTKMFVAHEMVLLTSVLTAFVAFFVPLVPIAVELLYSSEFAVAIPFVSVAMIGVLLRGISYCMSYLILAKGDGPIFLLTETVSAVSGLLLNVWAFRKWGVDGLGVAYTLWYLLYVVTIALVYYRRYRLSLPRRLLVAIGVEVICVPVCVAVALILGPWYAAVPGLLTVGLSFCVLRKIMRRA